MTAGARETAQVSRAQRDAMTRHGSARVAAAAFGEDVRRMQNSPTERDRDFWLATGLVRLYARIAFRLAAAAADSEAPPATV